MIHGERQPDLRRIGTEYRTQRLAGIHILTKVHRLTLYPARERQADLSALQIRQRQSQRRLGSFKR